MIRTGELRLLGRTYILVPAALTAYALALHWAYSDIIQPSFAYSGLLYQAAGWEVVVLTWIIAVLTALTLPRRVTRPSAMVLWIVYVVSVAPTILMSTYLGVLTQWNAVWVSLGFGIAFALVCLFTRPNRATRPLFHRVSPTSFWLIVAMISGLVYVYLALAAGLSLQFLSVLDVYDVRDDYAEILSGAGVLGYLVSTQANVINPLIITRGIYSRRWGIVAVGIIGQLILYSGTGFKTILFSIPALIVVAIIFRANPRPRALVLLWGATGLILVAAWIDSMQDGILWSSLFARRFLVTPASLSVRYVDFYTNNPFDMLSHSVLAPFFAHPPNEYAPPLMIGYQLSGTPFSANANLFAEGFAQFGWLGVAGAAALLTIYIRVLDRAACGLPVAVSSLVVIMPAVTLSNTSLFTAMFSHGLVAAVAVLAVAPRQGWDSRPTRSSRLKRVAPINVVHDA